MKVLLVKDVKSKSTAMAFGISVGSNEDPREVPGLAHLLEHMLPTCQLPALDMNDFETFISENGGKHNGMTSEDTIINYFEVQKDQFGESLNRFVKYIQGSRFFKDDIEKEIKIVNSEYEKNVSSEDKKLFYLIKCAVAEQDSILNHFGSGNSESLSVNNIDKHL